MSRNKIYEKDTLYNVLRYYVDYCTKSSYTRTEVRGYENIPKDGAVIIAPNHCNTLMDALVILRAFKDESVFGARADIFRKPLIAKIMFFLRILPMVRQRDGLRNVLKNIETNDMIVETLENGVRFCIYPEGRHRAKHSLLPISKGISRIAMSAHQKFGAEKPVYIVPTGIEYGDYFRYRSTSLVTFGCPINASEIINECKDSHESVIHENIRKALSENIAQNITYLPDDEEYENRWALLKILIQAQGDRSRKDLTERLKDNRNIAAMIERLLNENHEEMSEVLKDAGKFEYKRKKAGVSIFSFRRNLLSSTLIKTIIALVLFPLWVFFAVISSPMWLTYELLKVKDKAFRNTKGMIIKLIGLPVVMIIWGVLFFVTMPWYLALPLTLLAIPAYSIYFDGKNFARVLISDYRLLFKKGLRKRFHKVMDKAMDLI